jgi:exodeoxyribonuclease VII small subunit
MNEPLTAPPSFEQSLAELERAVRDLEDGQLGLEDALSRYEHGVGLIRSCYQQLRDAEQRILLLTGADDASRPVLQPFGHEATAAISRAEPRRGRRSSERPPAGPP